MEIVILCISIIFLSFSLACMKWELHKHYELIKLNHEMISKQHDIILDLLAMFCDDEENDEENDEEKNTDEI